MKKLFSLLLAAITAFACISVLSGSAAEVGEELPADTENTEMDQLLASYAEEVAYLVNQKRAAYGLSELKTSPAMNAAAQIRAEEAIINFDHVRPDGRNCFTVLSEFGIFCITGAENLAAGNVNPQNVMDGWMHSEGHKNNILDPTHQYIGVGVVENDGILYWTQMFIRSPRVNDAYVPTRPVRWGDANCDYKVTVADSVAILQHIGNRDRYGLTDYGIENADVDGAAGVTANDALVIQKVDAGIYSLSELPLVSG